MRYTLITGANGEIGHSLIQELHAMGKNIIASDMAEIAPDVAKYASVCLSGDLGNIISDKMYEALSAYEIDEIFHLAALLSSTAEKNPHLAHQVNIGGTMRLLDLAREQGKRRGKPVVFLFPSTIAVYGFKSVEEKNNAGAIKEDECTIARTMYGVNKLYCERLGGYYDDYFMQLSTEKEHGWVDFRGVRFPGLISAFTVPSGGTSDYAPEMLHAAAQGKAYECFVREDSQIPFMAMPDGVLALIQLAQVDKSRLTRHVYNIGAFAPSAIEIKSKVLELFPSAEITFLPHSGRQGIVDSWCADVDDSAARTDWNWEPGFDFDKTFKEYLAPNIIKKYS